MKVIEIQTGLHKTAIYGINSKGNKRFNVDGKFYSDKQFDKLFKKIDTSNELYWSSHVPQLFKEIIENGGPSMYAVHMPLKITLSILLEAAKRAIELQDEKLIAIFCRLTLYEDSDPYHKNYDEEKTKSLVKKYF